MLKIKHKLLTILCLSSLVNSEIIKVANINGIVIDTDTKLMWQDNEEAKTIRKSWSRQSYYRDRDNTSGDTAVSYCENLTFNGFKDWMLPDENTLEALYPKKDNLQNVSSGIYWTSSPSILIEKARIVDFSNGDDGYGDRYHSYYSVRCVRKSIFDALTFSSLMEQFNISNKIQNTMMLSSFQGSESKTFLITKDNKSYFGTKNQLLKDLVGYSQNPFETIQKLTQQKLNEYLTIATIQLPILPTPLNIVKDEFESKAEFNQRVTNVTAKREAEIQKLQDEFRAKVEARNKELENRKTNLEEKKKEFLFENFALVMGSPELSNPVFDAETNTMFVDVSMSNAEWKKKLGLKIENREDAKFFKEKFDKAQAKLEFLFEDDSFILKNATIDMGWFSKYVATLEQSDFKPEKVAVTIENKKVAFNELQNPNLVDKYQVQALGYGESNQAKGLKYDDDLAPMISKMATVAPNPKNWLFAVAIENYDEADAVIYAKNSAKSLITAMQKRLGISERNTYALIDEKATGGAIKGQLERLLENVKEGDNVYFYYSGHGIPSSENGEAFILPKDVIADYVTKEKEFMARNIYKKLSDSKAGKVVAFVDSCYSGKTDGISNIKGVAAGVFKTKKVEFDKSKMVVLTAGTNGQFSNAYTEKGQRLFSYFVTKALINRPTLDINSLYQEVSVGVKDESFKLGDNKRQEPQIEGNVEMGL